jgi:hypothetical protein
MYSLSPSRYKVNIYIYIYIYSMFLHGIFIIFKILVCYVLYSIFFGSKILRIMN